MALDTLGAPSFQKWSFYEKEKNWRIRAEGEK